jgi:flavodoxin
MKRACALRVAAALAMAAAISGCAGRPDSVSGASLQLSAAPGAVIASGTPLIVTPSSRGGAARLAAAIAAKLGAPVVSPSDVTVQELEGASLVGMGSGIFDQANHKALLALADSLPPMHGKKVFIFSTSGVARANLEGLHEPDPHQALRDRLVAKGCRIVGEFNCEGFNDNSFLFLFGGMNKGRPNATDIARAESFAESMGTQAAPASPVVVLRKP